MGLSYLLIKDYLKPFYLLLPAGSQYINLTTGDIYWGRPILLEVSLTAVLAMVYLVMFYDSGFSTKVDRVLKGLIMLLVYGLLLTVSRGSGGCYNPAFGLA